MGTKYNTQINNYKEMTEIRKQYTDNLYKDLLLLISSDKVLSDFYKSEASKKNLRANLIEVIVDSEDEELDEPLYIVYDAIEGSISSSTSRNKPKQREKLQVLVNLYADKMGLEALDLDKRVDSSNIDYLKLFQDEHTWLELIEMTGLGSHQLKEKFREYRVSEIPQSSPRRYVMDDRKHDVHLELNTSEVGELLRAMCLAYYSKGNEKFVALPKAKTLRVALNIWCGLTEYAQNKVIEKYSSMDTNLPTFFDLLKSESANHDSGFKTENDAFNEASAKKQADFLDAFCYSLKSGEYFTITYLDDEGKLKKLEKVLAIDPYGDRRNFRFKKSKYDDRCYVVSKDKIISATLAK